jgi:hypothetical protein
MSGGYPSPLGSNTEEWTAPAVFGQLHEGQLYFNSTSNAFKETLTDIPGATWASGGDVNSARTNSQGAGASHSSAIIWSGESPSPADRSKTESYNGTSWTEVNDINSARIYSFGDGSQTSAFAAGGHNPSNPGTYRTETETWDGTSWTVLGPANLNTGRGQGGSNGVTTSGLAYTGESPGPPYSFYNVAEELDGSTWTNISNLNRGPNNQSCRFTSVHLGRTAPASRVAGGGYNAPNSGVDLNEEWNGTSWAEEAELNTARGALVGGSGTVDNCIIFGGGSAWNASLANTEFWNGSSWTELNDLATVRAFAGNAGSSATNAMCATGRSTTAIANTEEWTAGLANKTITSS